MIVEILLNYCENLTKACLEWGSIDHRTQVRRGAKKSVWHSVAAVATLRLVYATIGMPKGLNPDWS